MNTNNYNNPPTTKTRAELEAELEKANKERGAVKDEEKAYVQHLKDIGASDEEIQAAEARIANEVGESSSKTNNKKEKIFNPKVMVEDFIATYKLADKLPEEFKDLTMGQQLYVVDNLKKRIVNIVKTNGEIQYSRSLKEKIAQSIPPKGKLSQLIKGFGSKLSEAKNKEFELKEKENEIFKELINTDEGKKTLVDDIRLLTQNARDKEININEKGKPEISFISKEEEKGWTESEINIARSFNEAANTFKNMPYEWSQEGKNFLGSSHRRKYEKAQKVYEKAREEILLIKAKRESPDEKGKAIFEVMTINKIIQMDQLLTTHPEFEKIIDRLGDEAGVHENLKTVGKFLNTMTGANKTNRVIMAIGFGLRAKAKGAAIASGITGMTGLVAVGLGAMLGSIKGHLKGMKILDEQQKGLRYDDTTNLKKRQADRVENIKKGKKENLTKEGSFVNAIDLNKRLELLFSKLNQVINNPDAIDKYVKVGDIFTIEGKTVRVQGILPDGQVSLVEMDAPKWEIKLSPTYPEAESYDIQKEWLVKNNASFTGRNPNEITAEEIDQFEKERNSSKTRIDTPKNGFLPFEKNNEEMVEILQNNLLDQIARRVEFTKNKIEQGLVNFGNVKDSLNNEYNLIDKLNDAEALTYVMEESVRKDIDARLAEFLKSKNEKISKTENKFLLKQMMVGAAYGAGFASLGYGMNWVGEKIGLWDWMREHMSNMPWRHANGDTPAVKPLNTPTNSKNPFKLDSASDHEYKPPLDPNRNAIDSNGTKEVERIKPAESDSTSVENKTSIKEAEAQKIQELTNNTKEALRSPEHGAKVNFEVTLGKDGVPPHLETAFNEISADHLDLPADGIVNDEMATKSLNMAANMVKLSEGHNIGDIKAEDFAKAVTYDKESGVLKVIDHDAFNKIVNDLKERANDSWSNGTLQKEGGAIDQISHIKKSSWVDIMHAKGLAETSEGGVEGIEGHPAVTIEKINDFKGNPDNQVITSSGDGTKGVVEQTQSAPKTPNELAEMRNRIDQLNGNIPLTESAPSPDDLTAMRGSNGSFDENGIPLTASAPTSEELAEMRNGGVGSSNSLPETRTPYADYSASAETLSEQAKLVQVDQIYTQDIARLFKGNSEAWDNIRDSYSAPQLMETAREQNVLDTYKPLVSFMRKLQEITGLSPKKESLFRSSDETISGFIKRALAEAQKKGTLDQLTIE